MLTPVQAFVIGCLFRGAASVPEIAATSLLRSNVVREAMVELRSRGLVRELNGAWEIADRAAVVASLPLELRASAAEPRPRAL